MVKSAECTALQEKLKQKTEELDNIQDNLELKDSSIVVLEEGYRSVVDKLTKLELDAREENLQGTENIIRTSTRRISEVCTL